MTPSNIGKWADADPLPSGNALRSASFIGAMVYGGTPGRAKNTSSAQRIDLQSSALQIAAIYENTATDINGGGSAGSAHADTLMSDLKNCGYANTLPIGVAADEHLTASQINLGVQYQKGFYQRVKSQGWLGLTGGYGFKEYTQAIHSAGMAEWLWQCGSVNDLWSGITFWQDNTGTDTVAGHSVDRDWQLLSLGGNMTDLDTQLTRQNPGGTEPGYVVYDTTKPGTSGTAFFQYADGNFRNIIQAIHNSTATIVGGITAEQAAILAALPTGTATVTDAQMADLETKLVAALPKGWNVAITPSS